MKFEKLNENKIRITLTLHDFEIEILIFTNSCQIP